jgi:hypothetical protein
MALVCVPAVGTDGARVEHCGFSSSKFLIRQSTAAMEFRETFQFARGVPSSTFYRRRLARRGRHRHAVAALRTFDALARRQSDHRRALRTAHVVQRRGCLVSDRRRDGGLPDARLLSLQDLLLKPDLLLCILLLLRVRADEAPGSDEQRLSNQSHLNTSSRYLLAAILRRTMRRTMRRDYAARGIARSIASREVNFARIVRSARSVLCPVLSVMRLGTPAGCSHTLGLGRPTGWVWSALTPWPCRRALVPVTGRSPAASSDR